jgi:hypothetical protein
MMPLRLALLGCLAVLGGSGCSLLLDGDALTRGDDNARAESGAAGQSSAGTAGQGAGGCTAAARDTCDGLGSDCKPTLDEPSCPASCDGIVLNGRSYMACAQGANFNDAEVLCQAQDMHLIRLDDEAENNVTVELAQSLGSYIWLGASDLAEVGSYAWLDGSVFFRDGAAVDGRYQNFGPGQPVEGAGRNCVQLHNSADGPWSNAPCSDVKPYVCERF